MRAISSLDMSSNLIKNVTIKGAPSDSIGLSCHKGLTVN